MSDDRTEVAVVVRYTAYDETQPADRVALMSIFDDPADADAEAARLNAVRRDETVEYFVKIVRVRRPN